MNCPTCGAPNVILHKDIWECGWCGDSGPIPRRILEQRKAVREKQEAWWQEAAATARWAAQTITESAAELLPGRKDAKSIAWKAILCQVSTGLIESGLWNGTWGDKAEQSVSGRIFYPYRALANDLGDLSGISNSVTIEKAVRTRTPLFQAEGQLSDKVCGEFWELLIGQLPPYDKEEPSMQDGDLYTNRGFGVGNAAEHAIEKILCSLLPLASLFAGDEGDTRDNRYLGYFTAHWKRLRGEKVDPMDYDDSAVARIVAQFPELKDEYDSADLFNMSGEELLEEIYRADPQRAIAMWRSLPQQQAPLQDDYLSDDFFYVMGFLWKDEECDEDALTPLLDAVQQDDTLAEMVFRSRYVCTLHLYLIQTAIEQGKTELAEHLYALLQSNPLPREEWREDPDEFKALMEKRADAEGNVPIYHYCSVQVGSNRPYAYLTAGLPVKRGDHVRVPYGKKNEPKEGIVRSVDDYTRDNAPWPPEKTKRVLEILPKPQEPVKKEPAAPRPQRVEEEPVKQEMPPVTEEAAPADAVLAAETPQETAPPKKRKIVPVLIAVAVVLAMVVGGVLLNRHSQAIRLAAWEQQYQTAVELFAAGNYKKAVEMAEDVPENIAEQPALLTVAKAGVASDTNTEKSLRSGIDLLKNAGDLGSFQKQGNDLLTDMTARLHTSIYHKAVVRLRQYEPYIARPYPEELGSYEDAPTLLVYAEAFSLVQQFNAASYKQALALLQTIPADYDGELAAEIADLRDDLPDMIAQREEFEAQLAAYQAQQQQQKPKPPQTFNYGGSSTDTGPGSGHSLREDYDDPEDLYEDGGYDDLDEAWDEWEEGW